jgi:hypothetical protein
LVVIVVSGVIAVIVCVVFRIVGVVMFVEYFCWAIIKEARE